MQIRQNSNPKILKVAGNNPPGNYPEDMQIRPTFSMGIVRLEPSFPMIPGLSI
jgi:hypothetical protein